MRPSAAILAATLSFAAAYFVLSQVFLPLQRWYFNIYVKPYDPDPPFLPLAWVPAYVFPPVSAAIAGMLAAIIHRRPSLAFGFLIGVVLGCFVYVVLIKEPPDWALLTFSLIVGVGAAIGCDVGRRLFAPR